MTPEVVQSSITERLANINSSTVELLQFHWQDVSRNRLHIPFFLSNDCQYTNAQYVKAAKLIEYDDRVQSLGLCNFDTTHLDEILESGVKVVSNQVQVCYKL